MRGMSPAARWRVVLQSALPLLLLGLLAACAPRFTVRPQVLSGSFSGETEDGTPIVFTFSETSEAFRGEGTIGGRPVVVAGAVGWRGVGTLAREDGTAELVELSLAADGETVLLERFGADPVPLTRVGAGSPPAPSGPFTGRYRAVLGRAPLAEVTLVQSGALIAGVGVVAGDPAGIAGRTTGARTAAGVVTLLDGSQTRFAAELAADGRSLVVRGYGEPLTFTRKGPR